MVNENPAKTRPENGGFARVAYNVPLGTTLSFLPILANQMRKLEGF